MSKNQLDKLKQFFKTSKSTSSQEKYTLTSEIDRELRKESPIEKRVKLLKDLGDIVSTNRLEEFAIQKLWSLTSDMIDMNKSADVRHQTLNFYTKLVQGQLKDVSMMRTHFFRLIQSNESEVDLPHYFLMLKALTENGKDIQNFEEEFGPLLLKWLDQILSTNLTAQYLELTVNVIKFNAAYIDREIIVGIVQRVCNDVNVLFINDSDTFHQCLFLIETVICYTVFPNEILAPCITVLCRAVNMDTYWDTSYKIMKCLLGTQLGYASLLTMTGMLSDQRYYVDSFVLRGAVFHLNMNLWGGSQSSSQNGFKYSSTVLTSYSKVLQSDFDIVAFEVLISLQTLLHKCGKDLGEPSWDIIFEILHKIIEKQRFLLNSEVAGKFHLVVDAIEGLMSEGKVNADVDRVYSLIEKISSKRPESSILKLVAYKSSKISPSHPYWLEQLSDLLEKFYRQETSQMIRLATIEHAKEKFMTYRVCYEDDILEKVIIVKFSDVAHISDMKVRSSICKFLLEICSCCDTKKTLELLDIIEKVLNHPFNTFRQEETRKHENDLEDCFTIVNGLIDLFLEKIHQLPSSHAVKIHQILIGHLEAHYNDPRVFEHYVKVRYTIINWMLKIRVNSTYHIGYPSPRLISDHMKFSNYVVIDNDSHHHLMSSDHQNDDKMEFSICVLSVKKNWNILTKCLERENEKDWSIVQLVLRELPKIMQNKALVMAMEAHIEKFATTLIDLFKENIHKDKFLQRFSNFKKYDDINVGNEQKDFRSLIIPAVACLINFNTFMSAHVKKRIIEILKSEFRFDGNLAIAVQAFTTLLYERCEIFERHLADIILTITKISDTAAVALPILEFLSILAHLPSSFPLNLSQKQFSYVFAICLPYTIPVRYDHYTVSLAHHIIASWFLKSRIQWRKGYVDYIIEGIAQNIDKSLRDEKQRVLENEKSFINEDSSSRKRSSSLTEQTSRQKRETNAQHKIKMQERVNQLHKDKNFDMHGFHIDLIETCIDFMTRNTFSLSSALPKRIPAADFLLRGGGQTKTWIVGHNIVTITTNACNENHELKTCACYCSDWAEITIRKPSSTMSWMMKFENQVGSFSNDFNFHDLKALFSDKEIDFSNPNGVLVKKNVADSSSSLVDEFEKLEFEEEHQIQTKHPLQTTASDSSVYATQPIDIPEKSDANKEIMDDDVSYDDEDSDDPKRNPVRRVNSSPEMRSNWKHNMANKNSKDSNKSGSSSKDTVSDEQEEKEIEVQQKKKTSFPKETKVSCEAIPEEIVMQKDEQTLHRTVQLQSFISNIETSQTTAVIPKKQHSADDTIPVRPVPNLPKNPEWTASSTSSNLPLSPRYAKHIPITRQASHQLTSENDDSGIRGRSKTISVFSRRDKETFTLNSSEFPSAASSMSSFDQSQHTSMATSGISPNFVFVQLFSGGKINNSETFPVNEKFLNSLNMFDYIPPYEIHQIGVLYVGPGQANNEGEILRNRCGSFRYTNFLHNLGSLVAIKDARENKLFVNLESGKDGNFTYVWHDDIIQMTFHVATLMPNKESDPHCVDKKLYIGNDCVAIVYNESGEDYSLNTIKGQFNFAAIIVQPLELGSNLVTVRAKGDIEDYFKHLEPMIISDAGAPLLVRQLALHANMASLVAKSLINTSRSPYANNWLERLRKIKALKQKIVDDNKKDSQPSLTPSSTAFLKDVFTKYT